MDVAQLMYFLPIGLVAGFLANHFMKGESLGLVGDLVVGVIGAVLGGYLFGLLGITVVSGLVGGLITALVGAVVLLFGVGLFRRGTGGTGTTA